MQNVVLPSSLTMAMKFILYCAIPRGGGQGQVRIARLAMFFFAARMEINTNQPIWELPCVCVRSALRFQQSRAARWLTKMCSTPSAIHNKCRINSEQELEQVFFRTFVVKCSPPNSLGERASTYRGCGSLEAVCLVARSVVCGVIVV